MINIPHKTFDIILYKKFNQGDVLGRKQKAKVKSKPKNIHGRWYHKVLYYLTFKQKFIEGWSYEIELID